MATIITTRLSAAFRVAWTRTQKVLSTQSDRSRTTQNALSCLHHRLCKVNTPGLESNPVRTVPDYDECGAHTACRQSLQAQHFALVMGGFRGPCEEHHHILGHLRS